MKPLFFYLGLGGAFLILFAPLIGVLTGAFSGWVVSLFFEDTIRDTMKAFGIDLAGIRLWQLGATLGFIGGFFRAYQSNTNS